MDALWNGLTRISRVAILAGAGLLFIAAVIVTAEVLIRKAIPDTLILVQWLASLLWLDISAGTESVRVWVRDRLNFSGSDEISGYLFAVGTSWSMAYVLITRGHVRIDAVYGGLSARVRAVLDVLALLCLAIFVGAVFERAFDVAWTSLIEGNRSNTYLRIHFAWSQIPWVAGIALFFLTIVVAILKASSHLIRGEFAAVNAIAGAASQDEEIADELKGLGIDTTHGGKK
jgi:TRAP-type C4-dicarboxylate transport system permease small subunit